MSTASSSSSSNSNGILGATNAQMPTALFGGFEHLDSATRELMKRKETMQEEHFLPFYLRNADDHQSRHQFDEVYGGGGNHLFGQAGMAERVQQLMVAAATAGNGTTTTKCGIAKIDSSGENLDQQQQILLNGDAKLAGEEEGEEMKRPPMFYNKANCHEKRKFTQDISDFMVRQVLRRKHLLVEHNTSRDLKFSEDKRRAWEEVRNLLKCRYQGFDMGIENIKSHWRYRKRKVSDVGNEARGLDGEMKLKAKLSTVDFEIYMELKGLNMLERGTAEENNNTSPSTASDEQGGHNSHSASNSPPFPFGTIFGQQLVAGHEGGAFLNQNSQAPNDKGDGENRLAGNFVKQQTLLLNMPFNNAAASVPPTAQHQQQHFNVAQLFLQQLLQQQQTNMGIGTNGGGGVLMNGPTGHCPPNKGQNGMMAENWEVSADEQRGGKRFKLASTEYCAEEMMEMQQIEVANKLEEEEDGGEKKDLHTLRRELLEAQIATAKAQEQMAHQQKVTAVELQQAAKNFNEIVPILNEAIQKYLNAASH